MRPGESRDGAGATANSSTSSSFPSHLQSSPQPCSTTRDSQLQAPLRKRALTSHLFSTIETPAVPDPSSRPSDALLYHRPRRSALDLNLDQSSLTTSSSSAHPLPPISTAKKKSRASADFDSVTNPWSPDEPERTEPSGHIIQQAICPDVKPAMPSTVTCMQDQSLVGQGNHAVIGFERGQEERWATPNTTDARPRNEDVFLNIARSDSGRRSSVGRSELRRVSNLAMARSGDLPWYFKRLHHRLIPWQSRYGLSSNSIRSSTPQSTEQTPSPDQLRYSNYESPLHSNNASPSGPYPSAAPSSASAHPLDDPNRPRYPRVRSGSRSTVGLPQSRFSRTSPDTSPRSPTVNPERRPSFPESRGYRHSTLSTIRSSRQPSGSEAPERVRADQERPRQDGTESTLSTTAPSTVWDELEDLKTRIRKLELTGKLPPSSQEAMSSAAGERPRTAATTVTTFSSSPKHGHKASNPPAESETSTSISQVHPLLQSALAKANRVLSREVYNALEMAVTDALKLSSILGSGVPPSGSVSVVNGYGPPDRKARRKADSVCRSLTELCLTLSDRQLNDNSPASRDGNSNAQQNGTQGESATPSPAYQRSQSHEPDGIPRRASTTRISSRLDARRSSLINTGVKNGQNPAQTDPKHTPSPTSEAPTSRFSRLSTSSRTRRLQLGDDNEGSASPHTRSVSRAMTDINAPPSRVPAQQRASHEYRPSYSSTKPQQNQSPTSSSQPQQPQPPQPHTPNLAQSAIPFRRSYMAPATSRSSIQAGSRRYGFTPSPAGSSPAENGSAAHSSQPEQPSQTRIVAPSSKLATSYTPIRQNSLRKNSLDSRRFGVRSRPMSTVDDTGHTLDDSLD